MLTAMGAAHTELLAWFDAARADRLAAAGAWLRRSSQATKAVAMRGWADFADARRGAFRRRTRFGAAARRAPPRGDGRSPARRARAGARVL